MRKPILILAVLSLALVAMAGCGGNDEAASGAAELVPAGASIYAEFTLEPEGDQKEAIDSILSKFPGGGDAGEKLRDLLDNALEQQEAPISFRKDIEPWLGDEAAFFASGFAPGGDFRSTALLVATDDEDASTDALEKSAEGKLTRKEYKGTEYLMDESDEAAVVTDGFVGLGNEAGVKAVIDTLDDGSPLSDDDRYNDSIGDAAEDRLGLVYVNSPALLKSLRENNLPLPSSFNKFFEDPFVATLDADNDGVTFEGSVPEDFAGATLFGRGSDVITELPGDSWLALGQANFGAVVDFYVEALSGTVGGRDTIDQQFRAATGLDLQRDVIDWMGDFAVFARGTSISQLDGALVIETKDEAASGRLLSALERLARSQAGGTDAEIRPLSVPGGGEGFTTTVSPIPKPIHSFQRDGRVVFAYGDAAARDALSAEGRLGDSPDFTAAVDSLGDDLDASVFVLVEPILQLAENSGAADDADWQRAKPYLEPLSALIGGTSGEGDELTSAIKLIVK